MNSTFEVVVVPAGGEGTVGDPNMTGAAPVVIKKKKSVGGFAAEKPSTPPLPHSTAVTAQQAAKDHAAYIRQHPDVARMEAEGLTRTKKTKKKGGGGTKSNSNMPHAPSTAPLPILPRTATSHSIGNPTPAPTPSRSYRQLNMHDEAKDSAV